MQVQYPFACGTDSCRKLREGKRELGECLVTMKSFSNVMLIVLCGFICDWYYVSLLMLLPGSSYMVVDCGGGTVDITVHELAGAGGKLRELYRASGGPHGSVGESQMMTCFCYLLFYVNCRVLIFP